MMIVIAPVIITLRVTANSLICVRHCANCDTDIFPFDPANNVMKSLQHCYCPHFTDEELRLKVTQLEFNLSSQFRDSNPSKAFPAFCILLMLLNLLKCLDRKVLNAVCGRSWQRPGPLQVEVGVMLQRLMTGKRSPSGRVGDVRVRRQKRATTRTSSLRDSEKQETPETSVHQQGRSAPGQRFRDSPWSLWVQTLLESQMLAVGQGLSQTTELRDHCWVSSLLDQRALYRSWIWATQGLLPELLPCLLGELMDSRDLPQMRAAWESVFLQASRWSLWSKKFRKHWRRLFRDWGPHLQVEVRKA